MTHVWGGLCLLFRLLFTFGVGLVQQAQPAAAISLVGSKVSYVGEIVFSDSLLEFMAHIHRNIEMLSAV